MQQVITCAGCLFCRSSPSCATKSVSYAPPRQQSGSSADRLHRMSLWRAARDDPLPCVSATFSSRPRFLLRRTPAVELSWHPLCQPEQMTLRNGVAFSGLLVVVHSDLLWHLVVVGALPLIPVTGGDGFCGDARLASKMLIIYSVQTGVGPGYSQFTISGLASRPYRALSVERAPTRTLINYDHFGPVCS